MATEGHGGTREGAGRKPKADEIKLIEQLDNILVPDSVWQALAELVSDKDLQAIKLWLQYRFGMPKQTVDNNVNLKSAFSIKDIYEETQSDLE